MDAEIGVRNLADSFRYNALPDIIEALGLASGKIGEIAESFEDLPEFERLQMLVSSQCLHIVPWALFYVPEPLGILSILTANSPELKASLIMQFTGHSPRPMSVCPIPSPPR